LPFGDLFAFGLPEPEHDRQAQRPLEEREPHDDPDDDPVVAPRERGPVTVRGRVVMPEAGVDPAAQPVQQRVVDRDQHRRARLAQPLADQHRETQPELIH